MHTGAYLVFQGIHKVAGAKGSRASEDHASLACRPLSVQFWMTKPDRWVVCNFIISLPSYISGLVSDTESILRSTMPLVLILLLYYDVEY